ncbi:Rv1535 domain-containing protein [Mycolicibacter terrae]|uniref:Rv1535 domain-containing protein n=1 Tax=Mycolicibacter terrae TaxID=1788 RepID=UPI001639D37A|nr:Rv1535 domain-containing protein [Mycolicibacter terrae]
MKATEILADPLVEVTAQLLTVPVIELYALLWRAGVLEAHHAAPRYPDADLRPLRPAG